MQALSNWIRNLWITPTALQPSLHPVALTYPVAKRLEKVLETMRSNESNCPKEIGQLVIDYTRYIPNRVRYPNRNLERSLDFYARVNSIYSASEQTKEALMAELRASAAETEEVLIDCSLLASDNKQHWSHVAAIVNKLTHMRSLKVGPYFSFCDYPRYHKSEQAALNRKEISVIPFFQALELNELEHLEISIKLLNPVFPYAMEQSLRDEVRNGIQTALFQRAPLLRSITVNCDDESLLPELQFPDTVTEIELENCLATETAIEVWKARYAQQQALQYSSIMPTPRFSFEYVREIFRNSYFTSGDWVVELPEITHTRNYASLYQPENEQTYNLQFLYFSSDPQSVFHYNEVENRVTLLGMQAIPPCTFIIRKNEQTKIAALQQQLARRATEDRARRAMEALRLPLRLPKNMKNNASCYNTTWPCRTRPNSE